MQVHGPKSSALHQKFRLPCSSRCRMFVSKVVWICRCLVPIHTYVHESWVNGWKISISKYKRRRMGIFAKPRCVTLRDKLRSCEIRKTLNAQPPLWIERSQSSLFGRVARIEAALRSESCLAASTGKRSDVNQGPGYISDQVRPCVDVEPGQNDQGLMASVEYFNSAQGRCSRDPPRKSERIDCICNKRAKPSNISLHFPPLRAIASDWRKPVLPRNRNRFALIFSAPDQWPANRPGWRSRCTAIAVSDWAWSAVTRSRWRCSTASGTSCTSGPSRWTRSSWARTAWTKRSWPKRSRWVDQRHASSNAGFRRLSQDFDRT